MGIDLENIVDPQERREAQRLAGADEIIASHREDAGALPMIAERGESQEEDEKGEQIDQGHVESSEPLSYQQRYRSSVGSADTTSTDESVRVMSPFRNRLIVTDSIMIGTSLGLGLLISSRASTWAIDPTFAIYGTPVVIGLLWLALLLIRGSYDLRVIGLGTQEVRRAVSATLVLFATVAGLSYLIRADISRAYAFISLPLGILLIGFSRFGWRQWLYRQRGTGKFLSNIIVIGSPTTSQRLTDKLNQESYAGFHVVDQVRLPTYQESESELISWLEHVDRIIKKHSASAIAIYPGDDAPYEVIRQLSWRLGAVKLVSEQSRDDLSLVRYPSVTRERKISFLRQGTDHFGTEFLSEPIGISCVV